MAAIETRERTLALDGRLLPYRLERRDGRRRVTLEIDPELGLRVRAPRRLPLREIDRILREQADWLRGKLGELRRWRADNPPRRFVSGETLLVLGERWRLEVSEAPGARAAADGGVAPGRLLLRLPAGTPPDRRRALARETLSRWYRRLAGEILTARVAFWAERVGARPRALRVGDMRTRWGSCSSTGRLSFSWRIVMAPPAVLDYLVVHELCHLVHHDHSPAYWTLVERVLPEHRRARAWLRARGRELFL